MKILPCFLTNRPSPCDLGEYDEDLRLDADDEEAAFEPRPDISGSVKGTDSTMIGQKVLSFVLIVLVAVIALPTLFIYLFKSPPPLQDVYTFGVSYYKLLFILNLCAVMLVVSAIIFTITNFPVISTSFVLSLFCSIPLIVGLRQDMTMQQAMLDISFFSGWPFFIRPMYILTTLLLPAGILLFLFLQIKAIFSRQSHTYAFGGAALFLALATFFGTYELSRADQPTAPTVLHLQAQSEPAASDGFANQPSGAGALTALPSAVARDLQPPGQREQSPNAPTADTASQAVADPTRNPISTLSAQVLKRSTSAPLTEGGAPEAIEQKLGALLDSLDAKVTSLALVQTKLEEKRQLELTALDGRVGALSGKLDAILLELENRALSQPQEKYFQAAALGDGSAVTEENSASPKTDKSLANVTKQIDMLIEKVQSIETKTRDIP